MSAEHYHLAGRGCCPHPECVVGSSAKPENERRSQLERRLERVEAERSDAKYKLVLYQLAFARLLRAVEDPPVGSSLHQKDLWTAVKAAKLIDLNKPEIAKEYLDGLHDEEYEPTNHAANPW